MIVFCAPGRAGILGNPSDMYGGSVISCSLEQRAYATVAGNRSRGKGPNLLLEICGESQAGDAISDLRMNGSTTDVAVAIFRFFDRCRKSPRGREAKFLTGIGADQALSQIKKLPDRLGIRVRAKTDIPLKAGQAGSTAILVTILAAILGRLSIQLSLYQLAETARFIEATQLKVTCGFQDAYMTTFGKLNYLDFRGKESLAQRPGEPFATVEDLSDRVGELPLVWAHTGIQRDSSSVHSPIRKRWEHGVKRIVDSYERMAKLTRLGKKALLAGDLKLLGHYMNLNHAITRNLGGSLEPNERLIDAALRAGAWGAKLAGAGGGGTVIALHRDPKRLLRAFRAAGAEQILIPRISPGLSKEQMSARAWQEVGKT